MVWAGFLGNFGDIKYIVPAKNGHPKKKTSCIHAPKYVQKIRHRASHRNVGKNR